MIFIAENADFAGWLTGEKIQHMNHSNEQRAYFTISGEFDPLDISRLVGILPSRSWRKGEINPRTGAEYNFSRWSLDSRLSLSASLEEHVRDVLQQLQDHAKAFAAVSNEHGGMLQLVGYFQGGYPGFGLNKADISALAALELELDFDFYDLSSPEPEDS